MQEVKELYAYYTDSIGGPLEGKVYIGAANQNPVTTTLTCYWDAGLTQPVSQPISVSAGRVYRSGKLAKLYMPDSPYSIAVYDRIGKLVVYEPEIQFNYLTGTVKAPSSSSSRTLLQKLYDGAANIMDYGAVGDGVADDSQAFANAKNFNGSVYLPKGRYNLSSMTPTGGICNLFGDGSTIIGFKWTELNAPRQDSAVSTSSNDSVFTARGITFEGVNTTPALSLTVQSQPHVIRVGTILDCVFRGQFGLIMDNVQGLSVVNCDFIHNQYSIKSLSATNNSFVNCNFYAPIVGVLIDTSSSDPTGRQGGENLKFTNCMWIDGVTAIKSVNHNYLWLSSCLIDYFNSGIQLIGSKFARLENTYIGCNDNNKTAMSNYIAYDQLGCVYATGYAATNRSSGLEAINSEFMAYGPSSQPCMRLAGAGFAFTGIEEVDLNTCRFGSDNSTNTLTTLLSINTVNDLYMVGNKFYSPSNNNVAAPWVMANMVGGRFVFRDNDFANVFNGVGTTIYPATGDLGNEVFETAQVTLPCNGTTSTNSVAYVYKQKYKSTPRVVAMPRSGPVAVELLNVSNVAQDNAQVFIKGYNIGGTNMASGSNVVVDLIIMGA